MSEPAESDDELPPLLGSDDEGGADEPPPPPSQSSANTRPVPDLLFSDEAEMQLRRRASALVGDFNAGKVLAALSRLLSRYL